MKSSVKPGSKFPMMKEPANIGIKYMRNIMKLLMMLVVVMMVMVSMVVIMVMMIMVLVTIPRQ